MPTVHEVKKQQITETPLLLFECTRASGAIERWSTHTAVFDESTYEARILRHNLLEFRSGADDSIDAVSRVSLTLANADSHFSQVQRTEGWKGAKLRVRFVFWNALTNTAASESVVLFQGICNPPDEITESSIRLTFTSRMNMQRILLPQLRIQRRCPWMFPSNAEQRSAALDGNRYSPFWACGYSASEEGGCGNLNGGAPFTSCDYTREACVARGMFDKDSQGRETRRFGGIEFVPSTISVKSYGDKNTQLSGALENESRFNDFVPLVYGTAWYRPPIVFARNDGNLTRMEVLLGVGEINDVVKVVVNGAELPAGRNAQNATATGWYNVANFGRRNGEFNLDFPGGDPYGGMAVMSVVVPNRLSDGSPLPRIEVLLEGLRLSTYDEDGVFSGEQFSNNPAWVLLDLLRRSGWEESEIDLTSFGRTAAYCAEPIETTDRNGAAVSVERFQCNLVLRKRRSAADVIRGVRNGSGLYLTYGSDGLLELHPESSIAIQQTEKPAGSNSTEALGGGWPAYEFGDGTSDFSDILRKANGEPALRVWCRSTAETPNRYSIEFQDEFNEYQQDSLSLVDLDDAVRAGHEISASLTALGLPNFNQAGRVLRAALDKSIRGNTYVEFETGLRSIGLKPGDLITLTYAREGFDRQLFRIVRIAPGSNYQTAAITVQWHDDVWYTGGEGALGLIGGGRYPAAELGVPRPLVGAVLQPDGSSQFEVEEAYRERADGTWDVDMTVRFSPPARPSGESLAVPLLSLSAIVETEGGSLSGGRSYYYAVSGVAENGTEGPLSFVVRASVPAGTDTNAVKLQKLSFDGQTAGFHVYRGLSPVQLLRIAADQPLASTFEDTGSQVEAAAPPDANYHHANFYWRLELLPENPCTIHGAASVGNDDLGIIPNELRGKVVRLTEGKGAGQERVVASNDETVLTLVMAWDVEPDSSSRFVVCEGAWNFGALSETSPVTFTVPNRQNTVIHISGRAANVNDRECAYELSPLTRHMIGGAAEDTDVPDIPIFGLSSAGRGTVQVGAIGFEDMSNVRSISAGTLSLHCWNELNGVSSIRLAEGVDASAEYITVTASAGAENGVLLQVGSEVMVVYSIDGVTYEVQRGAYGTAAVSHPAEEPVYHLKRHVSVLAFAKGFFGSPASGSYSYTLTMPNTRMVVAELFVTNARGNSQVGFACYADNTDGGIRTLSGGQITMQVDGALAVQSNAVPSIQADASRAVRDVFAMLNEPPTEGDVVVRITRDAESYCELTILAGETVSNSVSGRELQPLDPNWRLGLDVLSVGGGELATGHAGAGLTVMIRF